MKRPRPLLISLMVLSYLIFIIFAVGVIQHASRIQQYDQLIYGWLKPLHPNGTPFFVLYTKLGNPTVISTITLIITAILVGAHHWRWGLFLAINMMLGNVINHAIKGAIQRPRPSLPHLIVEHGYSFPSGHATTAVLFFGTLLLIGHYLIKNKTWHHLWIAVMILMLLLLGISRLYVQVHYPSDVTAGFLLAFGNLTLHWLIASKTYLKSELRQ